MQENKTSALGLRRGKGEHFTNNVLSGKQPAYKCLEMSSSERHGEAFCSTDSRTQSSALAFGVLEP